MMMNSDFEAATIRNGLDVDVILRRRGLPILDHLNAAERRTVETYSAIFEAVAAGGAVMPRDRLAGGGGGGPSGPSREGRQSRAVDQAAFLRAMGAAISARPVLVFGKRNPVEVGPLRFWHSFTVDGLSVRGALERFGVKRGPIVNAAVVAEVKAMAAAVAAAAAVTRNPLAE
ncbi:hypothetical protein RCRHEA_44 [Rhodobacter phage RcRhea]|uniref:Uncharacterized protein n=1 Tax=Rhodobacter phage RcRhea TaxID=1662332 RepID=A0A0K1LM32_9CAUD|nr:hypothetical protein RCRHEA_44 [Rhodobacter phage RcRhea]AKU43288.1 hypothetical protein RCRHEA_44 [Rhodobacter phage RcRhea]